MKISPLSLLLMIFCFLLSTPISWAEAVPVVKEKRVVSIKRKKNRTRQKQSYKQRKIRHPNKSKGTKNVLTYLIFILPIVLFLTGFLLCILGISILPIFIVGLVLISLVQLMLLIWLILRRSMKDYGVGVILAIFFTIIELLGGLILMALPAFWTLGVILLGMALLIGIFIIISLV